MTRELPRADGGTTVQAEDPIFVVGVPRSGTTLLAAFLSAHPRISIVPETHFFSQWLPRFAPRALDRPWRPGNLSGPPADQVRAFWRGATATARFSYLGIDPDETWTGAATGGIPNYRDLFKSILQTYASARGKPRSGEKTPAHDAVVPLMLEWFPRARVLYVLRDPRAVVHSLLRTPWGSRSSPDIHALRWARSIRRLDSWGRNPRIRVVRYEQLVTHPAEELEAICRFLGENFDQRMIAGRSKDTSPILGRQGWAHAHLESALEPVSVEAVDRWRSELPIPALAVIEQYAGAAMLGQGYVRLTKGLSPPRRVACLANRIVRRALRRMRPRREGQGGADGPASRQGWVGTAS